MKTQLLESDPALAGGMELACWCGQGNWIELFRKASFGLLRCSHCGCHRIDPPPVNDAAGLGEFYTGYYEGKKPAEKPDRVRAVGRTSRFWQVAGKVPELQQPLASALDIGCGDGTLCAELRDSGWARVAGVDMSKGRIARARQLHPGMEFFDVALEHTKLPKNSVDLAILDNVIEHVPDPVEQLTGIREHLHEGSRLVMITPNMESGNFRLLGSRWTQELASHVHIFLFTQASLSHLARMAGYEVTHAGSFHLEPLSKLRWVSRLAGGDVKGALWTAFQGTGNAYSRFLNAGPMLYVVARVPMRSSS
jgi:2-polyprenyl-3-methyl-5-hydroxy-6-metoxy-1,4-benzoquinol methylase